MLCTTVIVCCAALLSSHPQSPVIAMVHFKAVGLLIETTLLLSVGLLVPWVGALIWFAGIEDCPPV